MGSIVTSIGEAISRVFEKIKESVSSIQRSPEAAERTDPRFEGISPRLLELRRDAERASGEDLRLCGGEFLLVDDSVVE